MSIARFGSGAHLERFCSCQIVLLSAKLSVKDLRVQKWKISAQSSYSHKDKWRILSIQYL